MEQAVFANGDLRLSRLGLGCMSMSGIYGAADDAESVATLQRAFDAGVNFVDTSTSYGSGHNQQLIGKAIAGRRDGVMIHCKFGSRRDADGRTTGGSSSATRAREDCEDSLRRFGVEAIDIWTPSRIDPEVPVEDTIGAMAGLVRDGKVRFLGLSEAAPETIRRAHAVHPLASLTMEYSLFSRDVEGGNLATCRELGIGLIAYSPLARGLLHGGVREAGDIAADDRRQDMPRFQQGNLAKNVELRQCIEGMAMAKQTTPARIALAWVLSRGDDIVAIPGCKTRVHLDDNLGALDVTLTADDLATLEAAFPPAIAAGERYQPAQLARVNL